MKRLQVAVRDLLTEYSAWSEEDIHVEFSDPIAAGDEAKDAAEYQRLLQAGLEPTSLNIPRSQGIFKLTTFPVSILYYGDLHIPAHILGPHFQTGHDAARITNAVQNLEYTFGYPIIHL